MKNIKLITTISAFVAIFLIGAIPLVEAAICPYCNGTGKIQTTCSNCGGSGTISSDYSYSVTAETSSISGILDKTGYIYVTIIKKLMPAPL